jgi:hypothetical protein
MVVLWYGGMCGMLVCVACWYSDSKQLQIHSELAFRRCSNFGLLTSIASIDHNLCVSYIYISIHRVNVEFQKAGVRGISILVASGDYGVNGAWNEFANHKEDFHCPKRCVSVLVVGVSAASSNVASQCSQQLVTLVPLLPWLPLVPLLPCLAVFCCFLPRHACLAVLRRFLFGAVRIE